MPPVKAEPMDTQGFDSGAPTMGAPSDGRNSSDNTQTKVGNTPDGRVKTDESNLQRLLSLASPELLERGVAVGVEALESLKPPLDCMSALETTQASKWLKLVQALQAQAKPTRTVVGVVGNTGAGKSSVISAILDEERLLPTNCMRACTASPTEISYNHSDDPSELYRAEVEFITDDDWMKELDALFTDLIDGNGEVSRDCANPDTEAGVAYAKIKAVYPKKIKDVIASSTPQELAGEPEVRAVLGTTKNLKATTAASIYRQLQVYVDSREKGKPKKIEYWPLIKVVRIFTKAKALATGACIVDLPGVQDSNAARAAVAAGYMKSCTGLWIVAPITRAVDDKTAKSLLGDSFKRQLKYDGTYSAVTFICSKTDDISVTEAIESLGLDDELGDLQSKLQEAKDKWKEAKNRLAELRDENEKLGDRIDEIEQAWDTWEALGTKLAKGETVYEPSDKASDKKRKRGAKPTRSRKKRSAFDSDEDSSDVEASDGGSDKENSQPDDAERQPLTEERIEKKMADLKAEKRALRETQTSVSENALEVKAEMKRWRAEKDARSNEIRARCIKGRNEYSRSAIKNDFAMGIRELDQETAAEEDAANFDPDADLRDYDAVAKSLPVFCVSSRAFQKLNDRLERDEFDCTGFESLEDTEIPQLQKHAKLLTEAGRIASCRCFLNEVAQLFNSMSLWANNDGEQSGLSESEKQREEARLRGQLEGLQRELNAAVEECAAAIHEVLSDNIYDHFNKSIPVAVSAAGPTATAWGAHRSEGGLLWATYKATCRRLGVFSGASGPRDFNAELFEPISKHLATGWERAFQRRLPSCLDNFARSVKLSVETFHREATQKTQELGTNPGGLSTLNQQLRALLQQVTQLPGIVRQLAQDLQRECSRNFTPQIQTGMTPAYEACSAEQGKGSFARMKIAMLGHIEHAKHFMFRTATNNVQKELENMKEQLRKQLLLHTEELHARISTDYLAALVGTGVNAENGVTRAERMLRTEMLPLLKDIDSKFAVLLPKTPETTQVPETPYHAPEASVEYRAPAPAAETSISSPKPPLMPPRSIEENIGSAPSPEAPASLPNLEENQPQPVIPDSEMVIKDEPL